MNVMAHKMRFSVNPKVPLAEEPGTGHNRFHPDIEPIGSVKPGEVITFETRRADDAFIDRDTTSADLARWNPGVAHPITGPVHVEGAEPGDVLEVEFLDYEVDDFGWTAIMPTFVYPHLVPMFQEYYLVKWDIDGKYARSADLPGVAIPAATFAGIAGVAPSRELMDEQRERERALASRGGPVVPDFPEAAVPATAAEGLRTVPPREGGGNLDNKALTAGSRLLLPVHVHGALFSVGDLHFSQGDGEVCGCGIEIAGAVTLRFSLQKNPSWRPRIVAYETVERVNRPVFATCGISVTHDGRNEPMDINLATGNALLDMIQYLGATRGLSPEQALILMSVAVDVRVSEAVDVPNPLVSAVLPLDIFQDVASV
jgi:formamidase